MSINSLNTSVTPEVKSQKAIDQAQVGLCSAQSNAGSVEVNVNSDGPRKLSVKNSKSRQCVMTEERFWDLIEKSREGNPECGGQLERLRGMLGELTVEEIFSFHGLFGEFVSKAFSKRLWRVSLQLTGSDSEDGFTDFREWLVEQGKEIYMAALKDPESLLVFRCSEKDGFIGEGLDSVAADAYCDVTGRDWRSFFLLYRAFRERWAETDEFDESGEDRCRWRKLMAEDAERVHTDESHGLEP